MLSFVSTLAFTLLQEQTSWLLASEKVYSVLTVLLIVFVALIAYLFLTNRRVSRLEKKIDDLKR